VKERDGEERKEGRRREERDDGETCLIDGVC